METAGGCQVNQRYDQWHVSEEMELRNKDQQAPEPKISDFRKQLSIVLPDMAAAAYERSQHLSIIDAVGTPHPPHNYLGIADSLKKFEADFLPLSPLVDPRGRRVRILKNNFPKFLNLRFRGGAQQKRAHTILGEIETGTFHEGEYIWEQERLQSLFWIPDVIRNPDAIYKKKKNFGLLRLKRCTSRSIRSKMWGRQLNWSSRTAWEATRDGNGSSSRPISPLARPPSSTPTANRSIFCKWPKQKAARRRLLCPI